MVIELKIPTNDELKSLLPKRKTATTERQPKIKKIRRTVMILSTPNQFDMITPTPGSKYPIGVFISKILTYGGIPLAISWPAYIKTESST
jgi:hypothetical protein